MDEPLAPGTPEEVAGMILEKWPRHSTFHPVEFMHEHHIDPDMMRDAIDVLRSVWRLTETRIPDWYEETYNTRMFLTDKRNARHGTHGHYSDMCRLFRSSADERFEDGMNSHFSLEMKRIIREGGDAAVYAIRAVMSMKGVNTSVAAEALRWLGHMEHRPTHQSRRHVLEWALESASADMRDGAAIGIEALGDPESMPRVERAARAEQVDYIRNYMNNVAEHLRYVATGRHFPNDGAMEITVAADARAGSR